MDDYSRSTSARATPTSGNSRLPSDRGFGTPYSLDSGSPAAGGSQFDDDESAVFGRNFSRQLSAAPRQPSMENGLQTRAQPQQNSSQFSRTTAAAAQPLVVSGFGTSPQVVDQIANAHSLTTAQRVDLHAFARLGAELTTGDIITRVWSQASTYSAMNLIMAKQDATKKVESIVNRIAESMDQRLNLGKDQKLVITKLCKEAIFLPTRVSYLDMYTEVEAAIRHDAEVLKFSAIIANPALEVMLTKHIKDVCSAVRNQYRRAILNGIDKQSSVSLSNFTYDMAGKFRREGVTVKIDMKEEFRCSMLRKLGRDNLTLLSTDDDPVDAEMEAEAEEEPPSKKRKRSAPRSKKGNREDWWGRVDQWLFQQIHVNGTNLMTPGWAKLISEIRTEDHSLYGMATPLSMLLPGRNFTGDHASPDTSTSSSSGSSYHGELASMQGRSLGGSSVLDGVMNQSRA